MAEKFNYKAHISKIIFSLVFILIMVLLFNTNAFAVSQRGEKSDYVVFTVPDGGWSTCTVRIIYYEYYYPSSLHSRNTFYKRDKWYTGTYSYLITCPVLTTGAAVIRDSSGATYKYFNNWTSSSSIYPGDVNTSGFFVNEDSFYIIYDSEYTGQVNYTVTCSSAVPTAYSSRVIMDLES